MAFSRCYFCMEKTDKPGERCPSCGNENTVVAQSQPSCALPCGFVLHDRYLIGRTLGQGGFGVTYIAWDQALELRVCVKEYFPARAATRDNTVSAAVTWSVGEKAGTLRDGRETFINRARKAAKLRGVNAVAHVLDVFCENDTAYLVMDYIEGVTLKKRLMETGKALGVKECARLLTPTMDDLKKIHRCGIIHRDIAPDNLIITEEGSAVLIDFDSVCIPDEEEDRAQVFLKRGFAAPEQYLRMGVKGPWTDFYAFAATFYYAVTGIVPPDAIERMRDDRLRPPSSLGVPIEAGLETALLNMLSLSADRRAPAAEDFCRALSETSDIREPEIAFTVPFCAEPFASTCSIGSVGGPNPSAGANPAVAMPEPEFEADFPPIEPEPMPCAPDREKEQRRRTPQSGGGFLSKLLKKSRQSRQEMPCPVDFGDTEPVGAMAFPSAPADPQASAHPISMHPISIGEAFMEEASMPEQLRVADVEFSALFPKRFLKGEYSVLELYIYEAEQRRILEEAIRAAEGPVKESRGSTLRLEEESTVSIRLECADRSVQIEGSDETQVWHGKYLKFDFAVFLEETYPKRQLMFTATVLINGVPATRLRFTAECNTMREQKMELTRTDILSAFVSYANQDRSRVAAIIQGMKKARPDMDVFFDVDSLRSGEDWQRALRAEIERRDILFLCWSLSAKQSKWVEREWRYALENKGLSFIEPIPLDPPSVCPPPKELASKHFNDRDLHYMI